MDMIHDCSAASVFMYLQTAANCRWCTWQAPRTRVNYFYYYYYSESLFSILLQ